MHDVPATGSVVGALDDWALVLFVVIDDVLAQQFGFCHHITHHDLFNNDCLFDDERALP